jgi:hypothetical protein
LINHPNRPSQQDSQPAIEAVWALVRQFNAPVTGEDE